MPALIPYAVSGRDLPGYLAVLSAALEGTGPALAPYETSAGPAMSLPATEVPDGVALVVSTSGSTGTPKRAMLPATALIAAATATHDRLGGPGQWLLPMPAQHIAGTQVLIRSIVAGTTPITMERYSQDGFVEATSKLTSERRYTSLVPTQLRRLLDAGGAAVEALQSFDGLLLGGAATPARLLAEARRQHIAVHTTYGMSETCGGCVYDGAPLEGTTVEIAEDGRITLRGNTIALGYLGDPARTAQVFDAGPPRGFRTDDIGEWHDGRLRVLGRIDDLIITGGLKVAPRIVEEAATALPDIAEAVALGLPDREWGQVVSLAIVAPGSPTIEQLREQLRPSLPAYALPRRLLVLDQLPLRGPGKPDRAALAAAAGWQTWASPE